VPGILALIPRNDPPTQSAEDEATWDRLAAVARPSPVSTRNDGTPSDRASPTSDALSPTMTVS
jgi:hypothetical protein